MTTPSSISAAVHVTNGFLMGWRRYGGPDGVKWPTNEINWEEAPGTSEPVRVDVSTYEVVLGVRISLWAKQHIFMDVEIRVGIVPVDDVFRIKCLNRRFTATILPNGDLTISTTNGEKDFYDSITRVVASELDRLRLAASA